LLEPELFDIFLKINPAKKGGIMSEGSLPFCGERLVKELGLFHRQALINRWQLYLEEMAEAKEKGKISARFFKELGGVAFYSQVKNQTDYILRTLGRIGVIAGIDSGETVKMVRQEGDIFLGLVNGNNGEETRTLLKAHPDILEALGGMPEWFKQE